MNKIMLETVISSLIKKDKNIFDNIKIFIFERWISLRLLKEYYISFAQNKKIEDGIGFCEYVIRKYPSNSFGYTVLSNLYEQVGNKDKAKEVMQHSPFSSKSINKGKVSNIKLKNEKVKREINVTKEIDENIRQLLKDNDNHGIVKLLNSRGVSLTLEQYLIFAKACQNINDQVNAFYILTEAQKKFAPDRQLLMRLGELLQDDKKIISAHAFFKAARACYPEYGAVRQFSFEIDNDLHSDAKLTLNKILSFSNASLAKFLPVINRGSPYFPDYRKDIIKIRNEVKDVFLNKSAKLKLNPSEQVRIAVKNRWIDVADEIIKKRRHTLNPLPDVSLNLVNAVKEYIGDFSLLFSLANHNDEHFEIKAILNGSVISVNDRPNNIKVIEVFIPTVFYTDPSQEKPSYKTVRNFLSVIYNYLLNVPDLVIIPRNQWNWRKCDLLLSDSYSISYHTSGIFNEKHIHIQESTLAGRCSIDHMGFAGFSTLAMKSNYISHINNSSDEIKRIENCINFYIDNNISKYTQSSELSNIDLNIEYVFIPMQVTTDVVSSLAYIDALGLLSTVAEYYHKSSTKVLVKRHPYCKSLSVQKLINELSDAGKIILVDASVHELIPNSKAVFTVNSGVGLEGILHNKKVIATGENEYQHALAAFPKNKRELNDVLNNLNEINIDESKRLDFLSYYINEYAIAENDVINIERKIKGWLAGYSV